MKLHSLNFIQFPNSWSSQPLWSVSPRIKETNRPNLQPLSVYLDDGVVPRNSRSDNHNQLGEDLAKYLTVKPGDLVFNKLRTWQGGLGVSNHEGIVSPAYYVCRPTSIAEPRFLHYLLRSTPYLTELKRRSKWMPPSQFDIPWENLRDLPIALPERPEQRRIADFLDAETARIERLVNSYSKLKALFIERHQGVIDSNFAPIEDATIPLKYVVRFIEGPGIMAEHFRPSGVPLVRVRGLKYGKVTLTGCNYLDATMVAKRWNKFTLRLGDRVISGSATMGEVSSVTSPEVVGAIPYTGLIILRPTSPAVDMDFVECFLKSSSFFKQIDALKAGAAMQHFGPTHLAQIRMPLPEMGTQLQISKEAKRATSQMQQMRDLVDRQLSLLEERRRALITAAVTGEFDVSTASGRGVTE